MLLLCSVTVNFVLGFDIIVVALQLLMSFVRINDFIPYHQTTEACNVIVGATNIDYILSIISTLFVYIFLAPGMFIITSTVVPGNPTELLMYIPFLDRQHEDVLFKQFDIMAPIRRKVDHQSHTIMVSQRSLLYQVDKQTSSSKGKVKKKDDTPKYKRFDDYASLSFSVFFFPVLQGDRVILKLCKKYFDYVCSELDHQGTEDELLVVPLEEGSRCSRALSCAKQKHEKTFRQLCNKFYGRIKGQSDKELIEAYKSQKLLAQQTLTGDIFEEGDKKGGQECEGKEKDLSVFFNLCRCVQRSEDKVLTDKAPTEQQPSSGHITYTYTDLCGWIETDIKECAGKYSTFRCLVESVPAAGVVFDIIVRILSFTVGHVTTTVGLSSWLLTTWKMVIL